MQYSKERIKAFNEKIKDYDSMEVFPTYEDFEKFSYFILDRKYDYGKAVGEDEYYKYLMSECLRTALSYSVLHRAIEKDLTFDEYLGNYISDEKSYSFFTNKNKENLEFIYLIKENTSSNYYKIGRTRNLSNRINSLQTGNPEDLIYFAHKLVKDSVKAEAYFHKYFADKKKRGEWFELSDDDLDFLITFIGFQMEIDAGEIA